MCSFPLQIVIIRHILTYYYYLNLVKDDNSTVKQALNIVHENSSKIANSYINNINNILKFCNNRFSGKHSKTSFEKNCFSAWASMGLINKVDMVCLSPVGYGV